MILYFVSHWYAIMIFIRKIIILTLIFIRKIIADFNICSRTRIYAYSWKELLLVSTWRQSFLFRAIIAAFTGSICTLSWGFCVLFYCSPGFDTWCNRTDVEPMYSVRTRWMVGYEDDGGSVSRKLHSLRQQVYRVSF